MNRDSGFDDKEFTATPYLKLIEDKEGATCLCYKIRLYGKLHFVKKIKPEFENDSRMRAAFRKENEIGFSLSHPNIPRYVYMEGIFSPEEYVVTEWIDGTSLDKFIENHPKYFCSRKNIERFINQLTDALDYLHQNGIIHRDLKPSNIMLSRDGERTVLLDLGYSITDAHTLTGGYTYDFEAPELIKGESAREASDYYSLGKILEFIEKETGKKLPSGISNLKEDLLSEDPEKRPVSLSLVKRYFQSYKRIIILASSILCLILLSIFLYLSFEIDDTNPIPEELPVIEPGEKSMSPVEKEEVWENNVPVKLVEDPVKEKLNIPNPKETTIQEAEYEDRLLQEVDRMIRLYYVPVLTSIDSLNNIGDFSSESMKIISDLHLEATLTIFKSSHYEKMFPTIPGERLVFLVNNRIKIYSDSVYMPIYMKYIQDVIDYHKIPSLE